MNTTCPNCQTEFNIPDNVYKPGRKARCAVCSQVFVLPEVPGFAAQAQQAPTGTAAPQPQQAATIPQPPQPAPRPVQPAPQPAYQAPAQPVQAAQPAPRPQAQYVQEPAQPTPQLQTVQFIEEPVQPTQPAQPIQAAPQYTPPRQAQAVPAAQPQAAAAPRAMPPAPEAAYYAPQQAGQYATQPQQPVQQAAPQPVSQDNFEQQSFGQQAQAPSPGQAQQLGQFPGQAQMPGQEEYALQGEAHGYAAQPAPQQPGHEQSVQGHYAPDALGQPANFEQPAQDEFAADFAEQPGHYQAEADMAEYPDERDSSHDSRQGGIPQNDGVPLDWTDNSGVQSMGDGYGAVSDGQSVSSFDEELDALLGRAPASAPGDVEPEERPARPAGMQTAAKPKRKSRVLLGFAFLLCFAVLGFGGYLIYKSFISGGKDKAGEPQKVISVEARELEKVRLLDLKTGGVDYYFVRNEKLGSLLVLEGKVVNNFPTPKSRIEVEARLLNSKGVVIKSQRQICGVQLSQLQLSVLGQQELAKALNDRMQIMSYNVNVQPGSEVPFMVVVVYPPQNAVEFEVTVVDASDSAEPPAGAN